LAGNTPTSDVFNTQNRITGTSYDAAGNQVVVNGDTAVYDAETRQVSLTEPPSLGGGTENYWYDGLGQRVEKSGPGGTTMYVYDALQRLVAEYGTNGPTSPCTTCYLAWDHLGTVRLVTDQNADVIARHDYLPFGEEIGAGIAARNGLWGPQRDTIDRKFTGKERDAETGLDLLWRAILWRSPRALHQSRCSSSGSVGGRSTELEPLQLCQEQSVTKHRSKR
jgi:YD repeat-containing protein